MVEPFLVRQRLVSTARFTVAQRAWSVTVLLGVAALAVSWPVLSATSAVRFPGLLALLGLTVGFAAAEGCVTHLTVGRQAHSFAFSEIPFVVGLFYFSPVHLVAARLIGTAIALTVVRRQAPMKVAFNLAQYALGSVVAVAVWHAMAGTAAAPSCAGAAALGATLAMSALSGLALQIVLTAVGTARRPGASVRAIVTGLVTASANTSLALIAVDVARVSWSLLWAVGVVAGFLAVAQRSHVHLQKRHDSLQRLNQVSRGLGHDLRADSIVDELLSGSVNVLDGVAAEVRLNGDATTPEAAWRFDGKTRSVVSAGQVGGAQQQPRAWWHHGRRTQARLSVPLSAQGRVLGELTVDSNPALHGFGADEEELLDALAQQASGALANGQLADQLRHQLAENFHLATHDSLTGLANRNQFESQTSALIQAGRPAAVLLFDLDRFKEVNDTLGHAAGDALLQDAGTRLSAAIPAAVCIARLGGDEFTVLLATDDADVAVAAAQAARQALLQPLDVQSVPVSVDASVGIALAPEHGAGCDDLLRHADVAMYVAKEGHGAVEVYHADIDHNDATRLSLVSDLREAIDRHHLTVAYQPKVALGDAASDSCSVEALVRWNHPIRGMVPPDVFIPVAEQTAVILDLTDYVLDVALRQCRIWLDDGLDISVAVNISPRVLRDPSFGERLVAMLAEHRIPAPRLILEITESAVMADVTHTVAVLWALRQAGVRLAIDDLGVGHSSLAYLKRLPVHEVKIDKSFVMTMTDDPADDAIVCAVIGLAHRLGLSVVAEGVETKLARDRLAEIGCDVAQGYWYSRPVPAVEIRPFFLALHGERADRMPAPALRVAQ
jgi:diguanylate cyclase (GGDEF)-like protein